MLYLDTSFAAPLFLPEASSVEIAAFVRNLPSGEFAVSHWTTVEFSSILARKVRANDLSASEAAMADARFETVIGASFVVLLPDADDFAIARRFVQRFETGLRAPDALHLAIAANRGAEMIYSLDKKLVAAAERLGLPVSPGPGAG